MRNNRDRNGRPYYFKALEPLAGAITNLQPASLPPSKPASKLGVAQRKRERKAAKRLADACRCLGPASMKVGGRYNWKGQPERLAYLGRKGCWHQFELADQPGHVWCEVLDEHLHMLETSKGGALVSAPVEQWTPALDVQVEGTPSPPQPWVVERVTARRADGCPMYVETLLGRQGGIVSFATREEAQAAADRANGGEA